MPVVINDFEVVTEREAGARPADPAAGSAEAQVPVLTPRDIETLLRQQLERLARVRAH